MTRRWWGAALALALAFTLAGCNHEGDRTAGPAVGNLADGAAVFTTNCATCHGATGVEGGVGPSLRDERERKDLDATVDWIEHPAPPMPALYPSPLTRSEVTAVATYVQSL